MNTAMGTRTAVRPRSPQARAGTEHMENGAPLCGAPSVFLQNRSLIFSTMPTTTMATTATTSGNHQNWSKGRLATFMP